MSKVIEEAKKYTHFDGSSKYSNSSFQLILDLITELESKNKEIAGLELVIENYRLSGVSREYEQQQKETERYKAVVEQFTNLMNESEGVAGLHLNGDIADWDWLQDEWLSELYNLKEKSNG